MFPHWEICARQGRRENGVNGAELVTLTQAK